MTPIRTQRRLGLGTLPCTGKLVKDGKYFVPIVILTEVVVHFHEHFHIGTQGVDKMLAIFKAWGSSLGKMYCWVGRCRKEEGQNHHHSRTSFHTYNSNLCGQGTGWPWLYHEDCGICGFMMRTCLRRWQTSTKASCSTGALLGLQTLQAA